MDKNNIEVSNEELEAEQKALAEAKEDEVRTAIITDFGFDEVDDADKIDKLVAKEMMGRKTLSQAIGQKIKYRDLAKNTPEPPKTNTNVVPSEELDKKVAETVNGVLEKRDLESLELPDEIKTAIQNIAKVQNISVKKAAQDPYAVFLIEENKKAHATDEAAVSRTNKTGGKKVFSFDNPPEVDMSTEEGRKEFDAWKAEMKKQGY